MTELVADEVKVAFSSQRVRDESEGAKRSPESASTHHHQVGQSSSSPDHLVKTETSSDDGRHLGELAHVGVCRFESDARCQSTSNGQQVRKSNTHTFPCP